MQRHFAVDQPEERQSWVGLVNPRMPVKIGDFCCAVLALQRAPFKKSLAGFANSGEPL